jgi:hypothetical protein
VERSLQDRHIAALARCKVCLAANEDMMHALMRCSHAQKFWVEARDWLHLKIPELHPITWSRDILCDPMFAETDRAKIVTVMWAIWTSRNNLVHDKGSLDPAIFLKSVRESLVLLDIPVQHAKILPGHGWRPPEVGWVKINTDAGISSEELKGGAGGIARDQSGFIGAWCKPYPGVTNPMIAEALSL